MGRIARSSLLIAALVGLGEARASDPLAPGTNAAGIIAADTETTTSPLLAEHARRHPEHPVPRAVHYAFDARGTPAFTLELTSKDFDAWIVVRAEDGTVLAEADGGFYHCNARVTVTGDAAAAARAIEAVSVLGTAGAFELRVIAGDAAAPDLEQRKALDGAEAQQLLASAPADDVATLADAMRFNLYGRTLTDDGDLAHGIQLLEKALSVRKRLLGDEDVLVAESLDDLGVAKFTGGDDAAAAPLMLRALELRERTLKPGNLALQASLHNCAGVCFRASQYDKAQSFAERGLANALESFGPDHLEWARAAAMLGAILRRRETHDQVIALLDKAIPIFEREQGGADADLAEARNLRGMCLQSLGRIADARADLEAALALKEHIYGKDHPEYAIALNNVALLLKRSGAYDEAMPLYQQAIEILTRSVGEEHPETIRTVTNLGGLYIELGRFEDARPLLEHALELRIRVLGEDHDDTARSRRNLALVLKAQGRTQDLCAQLERVLAVQRRKLGDENFQVALTMQQLGEAEFDGGNRERGLALLRDSLARIERGSGPDHVETAIARYKLANRLTRTRDFDAAEQLYALAHATFEQKLGPHHASMLNLMHDEAVLLAQRGDSAGASAKLEQVIADLDATFGPGHPHAQTTRIEVALLASESSQFDHSRALIREALENLDRYVARSLPVLAESERFDFLAKERFGVEALLSLPRAGAGTKQDARAKQDAEAWDAVVAWKGRALRAALADRDRLRAAAPDVSKLADELRQLEGQLAIAAYAPPAKDPTARAASLTALRDRVDEKQRALGLRLRATDAPADNATGADVCAALPPKSAFIDYFIYEDVLNARRNRGSDGDAAPHAQRLTAFVVTADGKGPHRIDLGPLADIERALANFLQSLQQQRGSAPATADATGSSALRTAGAALRGLVWDEVAAIVGDAETVFVAPDGCLGTLPFCALPADANSWLLERHAFVTMSDARSIVRAHAAAPVASGPALVLGGVVYNDGAAPPANAVAVVDRGSFQDYWQFLPGTLREADIVQDLLAPTRKSVTRLSGADATKAALRAKVAGNEIVHLATHAFFQRGPVSIWDDATQRARDASQANDPAGQLAGMPPGLACGLVLAGANAAHDDARTNDAILTAEEIAWMDLAATRLVVLSACETGIGVARAGDGMASLQRAFQIAGARTVIASLWYINDGSTADLMRDFYVGLQRKGLGPAAALRRAQLKLLDESRARGDADGNPTSWGAFVLSGDWR